MRFPLRFLFSGMGINPLIKGKNSKNKFRIIISLAQNPIIPRHSKTLCYVIKTNEDCPLLKMNWLYNQICQLNK